MATMTSKCASVLLMPSLTRTVNGTVSAPSAAAKVNTPVLASIEAPAMAGPASE